MKDYEGLWTGTFACAFASKAGKEWWVGERKANSPGNNQDHRQHSESKLLTP